MTPEELATAIRHALTAAVDAGDLAVDVPDVVRVERPKQKGHGDWSTNVAMQLAKGAGRPPRDVAQAIAAHLGQAAGVAAVEVAGPGFLNLFMSDAWYRRALAEMYGDEEDDGDSCGETDGMP